jgi:hypothetical protein
VTVVEEGCSFSADRTRGQITLQAHHQDLAGQVEGLKSADARRLAISYAGTQGMGDPAINGSLEGPFPINNYGQAIDQAQLMGGQADPDDPSKQVVGYRVTVPVARNMR